MGDLVQAVTGEQKKSKTSEHTVQDQSKKPLPFEKLPLGILLRAMIGQMAQPPNTAISVPTQQALSNLQGGSMGMANAFGIGGHPNQQTGGLQTRAQMGLPDRSSYFGSFMPSVQDIQTLGLPPLPANKKDPNVKGHRKGNKASKKAEKARENRAATPGE